MLQAQLIRAGIAALLVLALCAGLVWRGYRMGADAVRAEHADAAQRAMEAVRRDQARELATRAEEAQRNAATAQRLRGALAEVRNDVGRTATPDCVRGAESVRLLNGAIDAANAMDTAGGVSGAMPSAAGAGRRRGRNDAPVGGGLD